MKKTLIKCLIIGSSALVVAAAVFLIFFFQKTAIVPDVLGQEVTSATKQLEDAGFDAQTTLEYSDTVPKNFVISQDKTAGTKEKTGTKITVVVSKGKMPITVPNVINKTITEAEETLKNLGFSVFIEENFSDTIPKGIVISQSLLANEQLPEATSITITVSKGPDLVTVPSIKGMSKEKADQVLIAAGLTLKTEIQCSNTIPEDNIISQSIAPNTQIKRNSIIVAKVSAGVANTVGTTAENASSFGMVTSQGNWVYYVGSDHRIHRMHKENGKVEVIGDFSAVSLNVVGEWIYFADGSSDGGIYKIMLDGTQKTKLSNVTSYKVFVDGEWIYYTSNYWGGSLYKMKTDGSSVTQIFSEECDDYVVCDKYIYYTKRKSNTDHVYRCTTEGKENKIFSSGFCGMHIAMVDNKIAIVSYDHKIQVANLDGSSFASFGNYNVQCSFLNGYNGWIYYLENDFTDHENISSAFVKVRPDGSQKSKIYVFDFLNHANTYLNVVDEWIYFQNEHDGDAPYRIKTDGTNLEKLQ